MELHGKIVLITGASDGIGAALAREFARKGARLALVARTAEKLREVGGEAALVIPGDLLDLEFRAGIVRRVVDHFGRLDVLVNNAGVGLYAPSWRAPMADVRRMFELNFFAAVDLVQQAVPELEKTRGAVVNMSSIGGMMPLPWFSLYTGSKYGLSGFTEGLRIELKPKGIHAMTVCPGYVRTGFQTNALSGAPPDKLWKARKFAITPEECARASVRGLERRARVVVTPWIGWLMLWARWVAPGLVDRELQRIYGTLDMENLKLK